MSKVLEIRKAGFTNKGAAMMLIAATRQIRASIPGATVAVAPDVTHPFPARAEHGLWHRAELIRGGVDFGRLTEIVPQRLRRRFGFICEGEVDVILDAAGLAYSDHWGVGPTLDLARHAERWKRQGKKLILLPQAFGPFNSETSRNAIRRVADKADLIFARDKTSYRHLVGAVGERTSIRQAPDYTNLLAASPPGDVVDHLSKPVAIVPNFRMIDKTDADEAAAYVEAMRYCARRLQLGGLNPFLLIHEGREDMILGQDINRGLASPLKVVWPSDPLVAKGIIANCSAVVASRFHALVSALAQGIPAIGTSWGHKYTELFAEYQCPECLISTMQNTDELDRAMDLLTADSQRANLKSVTQRQSDAMKNNTREMWVHVFNSIDR